MKVLEYTRSVYHTHQRKIVFLRGVYDLFTAGLFLWAWGVDMGMMNSSALWLEASQAVMQMFTGQMWFFYFIVLSALWLGVKRLAKSILANP